MRMNVVPEPHTHAVLFHMLFVCLYTKSIYLADKILKEICTYDLFPKYALRSSKSINEGWVSNLTFAF